MTEEYVDIVTEDNRVIGQELRRTVHSSGLWHRGVHIFLFDPDRRLLVQKRSSNQDTFPGFLDCTVSEHLKPGESYKGAAERGLREELGLQQIPLRRILQFRMSYGPNDNMISEVYEGIYDNQPLHVDPIEIEEIAFYNLSELEQMIGSDQVYLTSWFQQLLLWRAGKQTTLKVTRFCSPITFLSRQ